MDHVEAHIKSWALECGFDACGIAHIEECNEAVCSLKGWLEKGYAGNMNYLQNNLSLRANPKNILPSAKSMIMVLLNYYPQTWQPKDMPQIASYAYGNDYHYVIKQRLNSLAEKINEAAQHEYAVFTDSAPIMERFWAVKAGLGWIGKSGMLVNPHLGTFTFIGTLITSLQLRPDIPIDNRCGNCRKCIDACPMHAINDNKTIDARKCISYLTIENHNDIPDDLSSKIGNRLYGCDECQLACPWNRFAKPNHIHEFEPIEGIWDIEWANISRSEFKHKLKFSAMQRAGYKKLLNRAKQIKGE